MNSSYGKCAAVAALVIAEGGAAAVAEEGAQRELKAHEHGRGSLNLVLEGKTLGLELEAPGMDIVGFEHAAESTDSKAKVDKAKAKLSAAGELFRLPAAARCRLKESAVELESGKDHDEHEDEKGEDASESGGGHSAFHATYTFICDDPDQLTTIETTYFSAFTGAATLTASIVTSKTQRQAELSKEMPVIDLSASE